MGPPYRPRPSSASVDPGAPRQSDHVGESLTACRDALSRSLEASDGTLNDSAVAVARASIVGFAVTAARSGRPPEQTLTALKKMLFELSAVQRLPIDQRNDLVRSLVRVAIESYYDIEKR